MLDSRQGFTLIEMSMVLVIIGLVVGGLVTGRSLIRAAELRTIVSEHQRFLTAAMAFRDKYGQLPGDMSNADQIFGCTSCDGNNDGTINWATYGTSYLRPEPFYFWEHLGLAHMIAGSYSGGGVLNPGDAEPGINVPASKIGRGAFWFADNASTYGIGPGIGNNYWYSIDYGNFLILKTQNSVGVLPLTPQEAYDIDTKVDDGLPATGKVIGVAYGGANANSFGANQCTTSANSFDFTGLYNISLNSPVCNLAFVRQF